jgi:cytochrome bd-type quinol oxidase subunit 1
MVTFMPGPDAESSHAFFHTATRFPFVAPPIYVIVVLVCWTFILNLRTDDDRKPWLHVAMIVLAIGTYPVVRWAW